MPLATAWRRTPVMALGFVTLPAVHALQDHDDTNLDLGCQSQWTRPA